jgi:radical SAM family uncharacterized protein
LTYPDSILSRVTRPARYTGGEWNSITKDWQSTDIKIALSYPDVYEIGMSNIALPILYEMLNRQPDVLAERVFAPWPDLAAAIKEAGTPLLSLESGRPLGEFDIIGFSLGYELTFTNVLEMIHLARIPVLAGERDDLHPVIIAGGSCALNPEPMADFIDFFVIGEAEELLPHLITCFRDWKKQGVTRKELLGRVASLPGVYVPSLYQAEYKPDGLFKSLTPAAAEASVKIERQIVAKLPPPVTSPVVPYIEVIHDRGAVEISRGCTRGCRFCNAGVIYRPLRLRPQWEVITSVDKLVSNCGYDEVSLVSLSTSDYSGIDRLVTSIAQRYSNKNLAVSLPSLRLNQHTVKLVESLPTRRKTGLTFAPEAASQRLQRVINKNTPEEELVETAAAAFERGWTNLKLYFMLGLPTETGDDVANIIQLIDRVQSLGRNASGKRPQIRVSLSNFVPKAHTPFQWVGQDDESELNEKHQILRQGLKRRGVRFSWQDTKASLLEAALSRGDQRLGRVIHRAWQMGASFDGWSEHFNYKTWLRAFEESGLNPAFYAQRQRSPDEPLPWGHIDTGISSDYLKREYQLALEGKETADCRYQECSACGLQRQQPECHQKQAASG